MDRERERLNLEMRMVANKSKEIGEKREEEEN